MILTLLMLAGCAANGIEFNESEIPKTNGATIVVYRPMAYLGAGAGLYTVGVNGNDACRLHPGSFFLVNDAIGKTEVTASIWSDPGTSRIPINAKSGEIYYIKMEPNDVKQAAAMGAGLVGLLIAEGISSTSGPFIFTEIDDNQAKNELSGLKQDCVYPKS